MEQKEKTQADAHVTFPFACVGRATIVLGSSGAGRSRLAEHLGLTHEEMTELLKPSPDQEAEAKRRQAADNEAAARRLQAVRDAVWSTRLHHSSDLDILSDTLDILGVSEAPSEDQQKAFFDLLPADVVGLGVAWGFSDTEVRDSIYTYAEENLQAVTNAVLRKNV